MYIGKDIFNCKEEKNGLLISLKSNDSVIIGIRICLNGRASSSASLSDGFSLASDSSEDIEGLSKGKPLSSHFGQIRTPWERESPLLSRMRPARLNQS